MPAKMHSFYLRNMYLNNNLIKKKIKLGGVTIDVSKIETPSYFLSTLKDHIAPWKATYAGAQMFKNAVFTLAESGHIAGVVNPPGAKYPHFINNKMAKTADEWIKNAKEEAGSWWTNWKGWAEKYSGSLVAARKVEGGIEDAPGSYVKARD
jgi:polyhydroxyalkanoate synthase